MRLLIIRHAIAVPHGAADMADDARPLTPRGERRFRSAARGLARIVAAPDALFTSPLPRARQTAEIAAKAWGGPRPINLDALVTGAFEALAAALKQKPSEATVALVGHEPSVSELLARVIGTAASERLAFRKGGAALLDVPGRLEDGGTLVWFVPPRLLRALS